MTVPIDQPDWQNPQSGMAVYAPVIVDQLVGSTAQIGPFDLSAYESIIVWSNTPLTTGHSLLIFDFDSLNVIARIESPPDAVGNTLVATMVQVRPQKILITNNAASGITLNVRGTSRKVTETKTLTQVNADSYSTAIPAVAQVNFLGYANGSGQCFFYMEINLNTIAGWFELTTAAKTLRIAQNGEFLGGPGGVRTLTKPVVIPVGLFGVTFRQTSAIAGNVRADILYPG